MGDFDIAPMQSEVLCYKPTVALVWFVLTAQKTAIGDYLSWNCLLDMSLFHEGEKSGLVCAPIPAPLFVVVQHFLSRG